MSKEQFPVTKTDEEWRRLLTPEQYAVLRHHGTESPGSCALLSEHREGTFSCAACDQPLFVGGRKFESGTGWPSFFAPIEGSIDSERCLFCKTVGECDRYLLNRMATGRSDLSRC